MEEKVSSALLSISPVFGLGLTLYVSSHGYKHPDAPYSAPSSPTQFHALFPVGPVYALPEHGVFSRVRLGCGGSIVIVLVERVLLGTVENTRASFPLANG